MALKAQDVLSRASVTLQDDGFVRWTLPELLTYLNDGMREIAIVRPEAVAQTLELAMQEGTLQTLATAHIQLIRAIRNLDTLDADPEGRAGGRAITVVSRTTLDVTMPGWQDPDVLAYAKNVQHVIQDTMNPRAFYVVPGNDGTGTIEVLMAVMPTDVPLPAQPYNIENYTADLEIPQMHRAALVDYVMYRAYLKDTGDPNNAARADRHMNMFRTSLGLRTESEATHNVKSTPKTA